MSELSLVKRSGAVEKTGKNCWKRQHVNAKKLSAYGLYITEYDDPSQTFYYSFSLTIEKDSNGSKCITLAEPKYSLKLANGAPVPKGAYFMKGNAYLSEGSPVNANAGYLGIPLYATNTTIIDDDFIVSDNENDYTDGATIDGKYYEKIT